jgi:pimeloyl-ACP methyl ester carboxylesterase
MTRGGWRRFYMKDTVMQMITEVLGSGEPVILIHGLGGTANVFQPQVNVLSRLFKCVRVDLPGSGRTPTPKSPASLITLADAIAETMRKEDGSKWHVIGHSLGTIVCQHLAVRHGDLVRSLSLLGPIHAPPDTARTALKERAAKARAEGMVAIADTIVQAGTSAYTKAAKPEVAALVREILMRQDPEGYAQTCEALAAAEAADVAKISVPTLLLTGDEDGTAPPHAAKTLSDRIHNSTVRILDRCGHWTTFEQPVEVSNALLNFLIAAR